MLAHGVDDDFRLSDGQSKRLLTVDILAGLDRFNGRNYVPVVRSTDQDGVDILARDDLAEVRCCKGALHTSGLDLILVPRVGAALGVIAAGRVDIAYGQHLRIGMSKQEVQVASC